MTPDMTPDELAHTFAIHGAVIAHNEIGTKAKAERYPSDGEPETRLFTSDAKTHGTEERPTATLQAIRWAREAQDAERERERLERLERRRVALAKLRDNLRQQASNRATEQAAKNNEGQT
jgi:hypothetical protein